jgi:hypothetical protein
VSATPISGLASGVRGLAALGCLVVAGRFAYVAVDAATRDTPAAPSASGGVRPPASGALPVRASAATPVVKGELLRVTLMVNAGPDRSEVWMGETTKLGHTPFIGDVDCNAKEALDLRVVPTKGNTLEFHPLCAPGIVRVDGSP